MRKKKNPFQGKKVGLVLSGGGSHGFAQLGALEILESYGIKPSVIVGCSVGALVGMCLAAGKSSSQIKRYVSEKSPYKLFLHPSFSFNGILKGDYLVSYLLEKSKVRRFSDLKIPLIFNATNINNGKEKIFTSGLLKRGLEATSAFPGVFAPVKIKNRYYTDGGIMGPVPTHLLPADLDLVIVIDVSLVLTKITRRSTPFHILENTVLFMQRSLVEKELALKRKELPLLLIRPRTHSIGFFSLRKSDIQKLYRLGKSAARRSLRVFLKKYTLS